MTTTSEQVMNQDEWLADLQMTDEFGVSAEAYWKAPLCALGVAVRPLRLSWQKLSADGNYDIATKHLGISHHMNTAIWQRSDSGWSPQEIADWFKAERDQHKGDLSKWWPM